MNVDVLPQMNLRLPFTVLALICTTNACADDSDFQVALRGKLASVLPDDTRLVFTSESMAVRDRPTTVVSQLPITLPYEKFKNRSCRVFFTSKSTRSSFSIEVSRDLFDRPRTINIKLDAPTPHITPIFGLVRTIRYDAGITKRMKYIDLPYWNTELNSLDSTLPPQMRIESLQDKSVLYNRKMTAGCMGAKWFADIDRDIELKDGATYRITATYNSGGLFPVNTTTRDFTYHAALHGD